MSEPVHTASRLAVPAPHRAHGRPDAQRPSGLRDRAWWVMRNRPRFTLDDLLFTVVDAELDGDMRDPAGNLMKYLRALERVGVLARLQRRAAGRAPASRGHVIWRLARDLGRSAPVWRRAQNALWDPNSGTLVPLQGSPAAAAAEGCEPATAEQETQA